MNETVDEVRQRQYWLHTISDVESWCHQCDMCCRPQPHALVLRQGTIRDDRHRLSRTHPGQREGESIFLDCYSLLQQVVGALRHPEPRGTKTCRCPSEELLSLRGTDSCTAKESESRISSLSGDAAEPGNKIRTTHPHPQLDGMETL